MLTYVTWTPSAPCDTQYVLHPVEAHKSTLLWPWSLSVVWARDAAVASRHRAENSSTVPLLFAAVESNRNPSDFEIQNLRSTHRTWLPSSIIYIASLAGIQVQTEVRVIYLIFF